MEISTIDIIKILLQSWKKLALVLCIAIAFSALFSSSLFIAPNFKSTFAVYPTNLPPFGKESGVEQLFQFFSSEELKNNLAKHFDLFTHYKIDTTDKKAHSKFNTLYNSNIQVKLTHYQSIEASVIDISPEFAQKLANGIIKELNALIRQRKKEKYTEYVELFSKQLQSKKKEIDSIENKLKFMRINYGLLDVNSQSKIISKKSGKTTLNESDKVLLNNLKEYGGEFTILKDRFNNELENYKFLKQSYDKNLLDFNGNLSYLTVTSYPNMPDKKNFPNRTVIVLIITLSSLLLASFIILMTDKKKKGI